MKKVIISLTLIPLSLFLLAQKPLSKATIADFATNLNYQYRYGSQNIKAQLLYILRRKGYDIETAAIVVESVGSINGNREIMLNCIYQTLRSRDQIFNLFYALDMKAANASELADYTYIKYRKEEEIREKEEEVKRQKYLVEHAVEIRVADSLRKTEEAEERRRRQVLKEAKDKEDFINEVPNVSELFVLFKKTPNEIKRYLDGNGYILKGNSDGVEKYMKRGQTNDTIAIFLTYRKGILDRLQFNTKSNSGIQKGIENMLEEKTGFSGSNGTVLHDGKKEIGTYRGLKNADEKIKCELRAHSYTKEYLLTVTFSRYKFTLL